MQDGVVISHRKVSSVPSNGESHALDSKRLTSESRFVGIGSERFARSGRALALALHAGAALHRMYVKLLNCVTGVKANETGHLASGVTRVTRVTPVLEGGWVCALILPFQIAPARHFHSLGHLGDRRTTASSLCAEAGTQLCYRPLQSPPLHGRAGPQCDSHRNPAH